MTQRTMSHGNDSVFFLTVLSLSRRTNKYMNTQSQYCCYRFVSGGRKIWKFFFVKLIRAMFCSNRMVMRHNFLYLEWMIYLKKQEKFCDINFEGAVKITFCSASVTQHQFISNFLSFESKAVLEIFCDKRKNYDNFKFDL